MSDDKRKELRLYIVTINESFYINPIIRWLIREYHDQIVGISIVSGRRENQSLFNYYREMYGMFRFWGTLKLISWLMSIKIKELLGFSDSISSLIKKYQVELTPTKSVNSPVFVEKIKSKKVDIIFSFCPQIFGKEILNSVKIGVVNKHCALLPAYKGLYPVFWAMLNGEKEIGVTLHLMTEEIDAGPILIQKKVPLSSDTLFTAYSNCHLLVPEMIKEVINHYSGKKKLEIKKNRKGNFYSSPKKEAIDKFYELGYKII